MYYREQRVQDIQSTINRAGGQTKETSAEQIALDAWREIEPELQKSVSEWLAGEVVHGKVFEIPEGQVRLPDESNFFEATTVYFGKKPAISHVCENRAEAELIATIANTGVHGAVILPSGEKDCAKTLKALTHRLSEGTKKIEMLAADRAGTDKLREQVFSVLMRWFTQGVSRTTAQGEIEETVPDSLVGVEQ